MTTESDRTSQPGAAWACLAMIVIALVIFVPVTFIPGGEAATAAKRFAQMDAAFTAIPAWVKQWMTFQHYVFAGSLLFVAWHAEARVYLLGLILSHAISYGEIMLAPVERLGLGLVSLNHLVWIPVILVMVRRYRDLARATPFGLWYHLVLFQLCFSLFFDVRDSALYLWGLAT